MLKLIQHLVLPDDGQLPDIPDCLYAYILAGNGLFIRANRPGLNVLIPVHNFAVHGLPALTPSVKLDFRLPKQFLAAALQLARERLPLEVLCWFSFRQQWEMKVPAQVARQGSVVPLDNHDPEGTNALIDLHSHGTLSPFFSHADNRDEQGFRIYAVLGNVDKTPCIRVRVGVYCHHFDIPASTVFEMPDDLLDIWTQAGDLDYEIE
jgi:PRTRC genetic system protein A